MNKDLYPKRIIQEFQNPKNYGKLKAYDGLGKVGNPVCGDVLWLYIKVGKNKRGKEIIKDISFQTFGCVAALATSSIITQLAKGKTIAQALKINKDKIIKSLGGLPPAKIHCSLLASDALIEAIYDYYQKKEGEIPKRVVKEHQRIEKTKKEIEKRYQEWVKLEEKAFEKQ